MNSKQRIQLHLHCMWLKPNHLGFHAKGLHRELILFLVKNREKLKIYFDETGKSTSKPFGILYPKA